MEYLPRTIEEVRTPLEEHHGSIAHAAAASDYYMQDCIADTQKQPALRVAAAKSVMKHHNDTLSTRGDRLLFQAQMTLRAMDAALGPGSPKVSKIGNFCHESFKIRKLWQRKFQKPETFT